jgi:hypothetical protein
MKYVITLMMVIFFTSCNKNKTVCYDCLNQAGGEYNQKRCMTKDEWEDYQYTDVFGQIQNKDTYCRKSN